MQKLTQNETKLINSIRNCKDKNLLSQFQSIVDKLLSKEEKEEVNRLFERLKRR